MRTPFLSVNGALVRADAPALKGDNRGFLYGDGAFETLRAAEGAPVALGRHRARLFECLDYLGIPHPTLDLSRDIEALLDACDLARGEAVVRVSVSRAGGWGEVMTGPPVVVIQARAPAPSEIARRRGVLLQSVPGLARALPRFKTLAWLPSVMALRAAAPGAEPLLLDAAGYALEGATTNVFALVDGRLCTPPADGGILPGIARALALEAAEALGWATAERRLDLDTMKTAPCCVTNAALPVAPVLTLDGLTLPQAPEPWAALRERMEGLARAR